MKGKSYLNTGEKDEVVIFGAFKNYIDQRLTNWLPHAKNKGLIKYARTIRTYIDKLIELYFEDTDEDERAKCVKKLQSHVVAVQSTAQAYFGLQKAKEEESNVLIDRDDFLIICEQAITMCQECTVGDDMAEKCVYRKTMIKHDVPVYNYDKDCNCPYKYKTEVVDNTTVGTEKDKDNVVPQKPCRREIEVLAKKLKLYDLLLDTLKDVETKAPLLLQSDKKIGDSFKIIKKEIENM